MFARLFRLSDRIGRLLIRISILVGDVLLAWEQEIALWLQERRTASVPETSGARTEGQVSSLSGLIVVLLVSVMLLIFWATDPRAQDNLVIRFLSTGATPAAPAESAAVSAPQDAAQPAFLESTGTVVFSMVVGAQQDLFALASGQAGPVRLTDSPADDRHPSWSPDGQRIAFSSRRDGNWELYILDLSAGEISRLTYDLAYEGAPSWSPDGQWLAYEAAYEGNLDIYIIKADGSEGPYPLTRSPDPDFSPAWTTDPAGREIAYVSSRDGSQDIYLISLDNPNENFATNLTNTPDLDETDPAWSPDGTMLAYSARAEGTSLVFVRFPGDPARDPLVVGQGHSPAWSPDGRSLAFLAERPGGSLLLTTPVSAWEGSSQAFALPAEASSPHWSAAALPPVLRGSLASAASAPQNPAYEEPLVVAGQDNGQQQAPYRLVNLQPLGVIAPAPYLSDRVDGSFSALREHIRQAAGWDFLGQLDSVMWDLEQRVPPGQDFRNWHKAGRAFDIMQDANLTSPPQIELVPRQAGADLYWHLYVRCAIQDGSLGEPLRHRPWDFSARTSGDVAAYENGGRFKDVPAGYYVDFTQAARLFGWQPVPAHSSWRTNWSGILFWQYEKRDGLDWWAAMLELYPEQTLLTVFEPPASSGDTTAGGSAAGDDQ